MTGQDHILQFFAYEHLPLSLAAVSRPFCELAKAIVGEKPWPDESYPFDPAKAPGLPRNPERTVALRKLLEAKDAAVRAFIAKDVNS